MISLSELRYVRKIMSRFTNRVKDNEGNPRGVEHPALFADHSIYEISFPNGQMEELAENLIAENMLSQVDSEGHHYQLLKEISDHSVDRSALNRSDGFIRSRGGNIHAKKKTRGWKLEVKCNDGTLNWIPLKDLKASNPVEIA